MTKRRKGDKTFQPYFDSVTEKSSVGPLSELALIDFLERSVGGRQSRK
jgi:hypothetical protein